MLDLTHALHDLKHVQAAHVVSVNNECKELLLVLERGKELVPEEIPIHCINLTASQKVQKLLFTRQQEKEHTCPYTPTLKTYLYEPNASILKAGAFRSVSSIYNVEKLHPNSHLYTSDEYIPDFPGRKFRITDSSSLNKKELKKLIGTEKKANLTVRNFPASVAELRKRLKLAEGGDMYLFATTLADEKKLLGVIREEIIAIADKYGDDRKTEIGYDEYDMSMEDLIPETNTVITMTKVGYIKRMSTDNFKAQHRGGKGIKGMETIEDDYIVEMLMTTSHHYLMFFTNTGRVYRIKAYEIPEASRTSRGTAIINLIPLQPDEKITAMIPIKEYEDDKYLFMATRNGIVKKTPIKDYENIRKNGLAAINLREDDKLIEVKVTDNSEDILLFTNFGQCSRFKETDGRSTGRTTMGVIGMNLAPNDVIIAMQTASMGEAVLLVSSNGLGKRTRIDEFTTQNRGGKGVKCYKITEKSGNLVGVKSVENDDELMLITTEGIIIRIQVSDVTVLGRITTGVKLINLKEGVSVASIAKVVEDKTLMPPEESKAETDESENSDEKSAENNNSHAEAIENNTEA